MTKQKRVWTGIGLYSAYLTKMRKCVESLQDYDVLDIIIADEIQKYNGNKVDVSLKEKIIELGNELRDEISGININSWNILSENKRFQNIFCELKKLYVTDEIFMRQTRKITYNKTKVEKNHSDIDRLVGYALEEIASIYYFAEQGYVKAGHQGERDYDKLALKTLRKHKEKLGLNIEVDELRFDYYDK